MAWLRGIGRPPKKKKLSQHRSPLSPSMKAYSERLTRRVSTSNSPKTPESFPTNRQSESNPFDRGKGFFFKTHQLLVPNPILQNRISHSPRPKKDHRRSQPNLKTVQVEPIDIELEAEQHIINDANRHGSGDAIVREHVFRYMRHTRSQTGGKDIQDSMEIL